MLDWYLLHLFSWVHFITFYNLQILKLNKAHSKMPHLENQNKG